MGARVAYVIAGGDLYSAMARISAASVRLTNPSVTVFLVCDAISAAVMKRKRDPLFDEVDEVIEFDTPDGDNGFRSRFVKTSLGNLLSGPFLYLDCDTVVRGDLSELFCIDADIGCAPDHSRDTFEQQFVQSEDDVLKLAGWRTRRDVYVNGGVISYCDTVGAKRLAADWHTKWLKSYELSRNHRDQPALNAAIFDAKAQLHILSHRFNAQCSMSPRTARDAAIWHLYAINIERPTTTFETLLGRLLKGTVLQRSEIEELVYSSHPWRKDLWIDHLAALWVMRKNRLNAHDYSWFEGHRIESVVNRLRSRFHRHIKAT